MTVTPGIWDLLREAGLPKAIEQLRIKVKEAKLEHRAAAFAPATGEHRVSERAMSVTSAGGSTRHDHQWNLGFRVSPYKVEFAFEPDWPFFRVDRHNGARTLHVNAAHRFFEEVYDAPASTPELKAALEVLLFCLGDVMLEGTPDERTQHDAQLLSWSRRLELALGMLASHLSVSDDLDVGPTTWPDELT